LNLIFHRTLFVLTLSICATVNRPCFSQKLNPTGDLEFDSLITKAYQLRYVNWDSAKAMVNRAENIPELSDLQHAIVANQLGALFYIKGDYATSLTNYVQATTILETENDLSQKVFALNGRGLIYLSQNENKQAVDIFEKCIQINQSLGDSLAMGTSYFNKGIALSHLQKYEIALETLQKGINITTNFPDPPIRFMIYNRQAQIRLEMSELQEAKKLFVMALDENPNPNNWEKAFANTGLGQIALLENNPKEALEFAQKAYEAAKLVNAFWDKERATRLISEAYEELGLYGSALEFARINKTYADSLYNQDKNSEISYLQLQLAEADNKFLEKERLFTQQAAEFSKKTILGLGITMILLITLLFYYRKWLREKVQLNQLLIEKQHEILLQNNTLQSLNEEKNKLFSILTHDLKTPINSIKQLLDLKNADLLNENEKAYTNQLLLNQVIQTDQMMDELLHWSMAQMNGIVTDRMPVLLIQLVKDCIAQNELPILKKEIQVILNPENSTLQILADCTQAKIIIQNCLQNAIKFSFPGHKIFLEIIEKPKTVILKIKDEGTGISEEKIFEILNQKSIVSSMTGTVQEKGTGLGMLFVKQFLERNRGTLDIKSSIGSGTEIILTFEKAC